MNQSFPRIIAQKNYAAQKQQFLRTKSTQSINHRLKKKSDQKKEDLCGRVSELKNEIFQLKATSSKFFAHNVWQNYKNEKKIEEFEKDAKTAEMQFALFAVGNLTISTVILLFSI
jgi:hypothetical protein